jgi:hypothetical protein
VKKVSSEKYVISAGAFFTIEWYFSANGKCKAKEYLDSLNYERQCEALRLFKLLANTGKIFNKKKFCYEGDGIYAFKPQPDRFLCFFFSGKKVIITNGLEKKQDKLPLNEKKRALDCQEDYKMRVKRGSYYE